MSLYLEAFSRIFSAHTLPTSTENAEVKSGRTANDDNFCEHCRIFEHTTAICRKSMCAEYSRKSFKVQRHSSTGSDSGTLAETPPLNTIGEANYSDLEALVLLPLTVSIPPTEWFLATAAVDHISNNIRDLSNIIPVPEYTSVFQADGSRVDVRAQGIVHIDTGNSHQDRVSTGLTLASVFYIPSYQSSVISVGKLCEAGFSIHLGNGRAIVKDRSDSTVITDTLVGGGYRVDID